MKQEVDLIPEEHVATDQIRRRLLRWGILSLAVVGAVCTLAGSLRWRSANLEAKLIPLRQSVAATSELGKQIAPLTSKLETALDRQLVVEKLLYEPIWCGFLNELATATGHELWLTEFTVDHETSGEATEDGSEYKVAMVSIAGEAYSSFDVIRFMRKLSASSYLKGLKLQRATNPGLRDEDQTVKFSIRGYLE